MIVQLTDTHVDAGPDDRGSADALATAVAHVLAIRPAPSAVVVTGDLVEHGDEREYARARELLAPLPMPVHVLPGNHDDRGRLRAAFGAPGDGEEPFRYAVDCGDLRVVALDTVRPGRDDGRLDDETLAWLAATLGDEADRPTIVAMHHTPLLIGIKAMDAIGLAAAERRALAAVLAGAAPQTRVVSGHIHRAAVGTLGGRAVVACPSAHRQLRLDFAADKISWGDDPPCIAVHARLRDDAITTHIDPIARG